ncbi:hypothetical protein [Candidatus Poriferisocius sp.]|uniref:hypothetical protein n=1 Tax=Candidatus Poriferisocius sp. TaxID=3101276 RepID=UPI003B01852B
MGLGLRARLDLRAGLGIALGLLHLHAGLGIALGLAVVPPRLPGVLPVDAPRRSAIVDPVELVMPVSRRADSLVSRGDRSRS